MTESSSRPRVLVLTYTPIAREPRALKQIRRLSGEYDVTTAGFGPAPEPTLAHIELTEELAYVNTRAGRLRYLLLLLFRQYRRGYRFNVRDQSAYRLLAAANWDVVIAHDVQTVTMANRLTVRRGVIVDLHEYAPRQNEHSLAWRILIAPYFRWLCRTEVTKAAAVTTVSQGIVDEYRREFGIKASLVVNATPYSDQTPTPVGSALRLVHSGIPAPQRRLEIMIEAVVATTSDVSLDLYLIDDGSAYLNRLKQLASGHDRVRFRETVPYDDLVRTLNGYDIGLSIFAPTTFNLAWCLPNKFFDFIQARLGVVVGPSPEMTRFVDEYKIGAVMDDFSAEALTRLLDTLTPEMVGAWKTASDRHARELSSEMQLEEWSRIVRELVDAV